MFKPNKDMVKEILLAIGTKKPDSSSKESWKMESSSEEGDEGMEAAADEIISAVRSSDAKALSEALMAFIEQCK